MIRQFVFLIIGLFLVRGVVGGEMEKRKIYYAHRVTSQAPEIDGKDADLIWQLAEVGTDFVQLDPVENALPSQRTAFRILYDNKNLYVFIRAYDSEPQKIERRLARRDEIDDSDVVGILIDSYFDRRTCFHFAVNAAGVKRDIIHSGDRFENQNQSWNPVWEVAVSVDDSGWAAEMRIPFSQLRFSRENTERWGLELYRYIYRDQELDLWQMIPKNSSGFVSYFGYLEGIKNIRPPRRIELLPYAVSDVRLYPAEEGNPFADGRDTRLSGGLDGKIGLTENITVDLTVNPDFGQVEADPSEVNLTAFETFFEEKRPFFIEGRNIFQFPLAFGEGEMSRESLFYSRRIGRAPQGSPTLTGNEYTRIPEQTTILGAAKLSGKTAQGWSVGLLEAVTAEEKAQIDSAGVRRQEAVEPLTNYFVGRLQKDFRQGNTVIGGMVTSTLRSIRSRDLHFLPRSAYSGGVDFQHFWKNKSYMLDLRLVGSRVEGDPEAMLRLQTSSARYYQRPDANYVHLDSNRTVLTGHGGTIGVGRVGNSHWQYVVGGVWRSPGLELNDIGYLRQSDQLMQFIWVGYRLFNPWGIFRRASVNINQWQGWNFGGEHLFTGGNLNGGGEFRNYWRFYNGINRQMSGLSPYLLRGGPLFRTEGQWNYFIDLSSDSRKTWSLNLGGFISQNDDGITHDRNIRVGLYVKPTNYLTFSFKPFYNWGTDNLQYVSTVQKDDEERYILARIHQKTLGIVLRLNLSITPDLTIQYYGQPFVSAGAYSHFKRVTHPRAQRYEDRFHTFTAEEIHYDAKDGVYRIDEDRDGTVDYTIGNPDFNFKQFRSNLVIRWEYAPGSLLYLVWSQGRTGVDGYGDFSMNRDLRDLFQVPGDNVFLIKLNNWFSI